ncbi:hypothetical protein [Mechercharimyces sp. CAU 1602]|uniref:hypothetical protein n=1 Tax=Mechercharimyces sp. CAU 1602 TaxID=2973933 RepID=UPI0021616118|nr:hypothetical protein [Mechercharimyces sp. CAU 1602]
MTKSAPATGALLLLTVTVMRRTDSGYRKETSKNIVATFICGTIEMLEGLSIAVDAL